MGRKDWINVIYIGATGLVIVITGVYLFSLHATSYTIGLTYNGSLGDAVNGLSAAIISFFSALLIYLTLIEQNKSNKMWVEANKTILTHLEFNSLAKASKKKAKKS